MTSEAVQSVECEACSGTGIEEGMEWCGEPCRTCFGGMFGKPVRSSERPAATLCHCGDLNCEDHPS